MHIQVKIPKVSKREPMEETLTLKVPNSMKADHREVTERLGHATVANVLRQALAQIYPQLKRQA